MTEDKLTISLLSGIVGVLLGGLVSAGVGRYSAFKESQGIAASLRAEISALLDLVQMRGYVDGLQRIIQRLRDEQHVAGPGDLYAIGVSQNYFAVFEANASKIGALGGDLAASVVRSYVLAKAIVEDLTGMREMQEALVRSGAPTQLDREFMLELITRVRDLLLTAEREGRVAVRHLREYQSRRWLSFRF